MKLRNLCIIQLASNAYYGIKKQFAGETDKPETLMKRMVAKQAIAYGSSTYEAGIDQFRYNMKALIGKLNQHHVPTFISTLVSNEKDLAPFISDSSSNEKSAIYHYNQAGQKYRNHQYDAAKKEFEQAKDLDMLRFRAPEDINSTIKTLADKTTPIRI